MYKLTYVEQKNREDKGIYQTVEKAIDEVNRICRDVLKFTAWGNDITEKDGITIIALSLFVFGWVSYLTEREKSKKYEMSYEKQIAISDDLDCERHRLKIRNDHLEFHVKMKDNTIERLENENNLQSEVSKSIIKRLTNENSQLKHTNKLIKLGNLHITAKSARSIVKIIEFDSGCHIYFEGKKEPERSNLKAHAVIDKLKAKCIDLTC